VSPRGRQAGGAGSCTEVYELTRAGVERLFDHFDGFWRYPNSGRSPLRIPDIRR
jgi:hypothetical protein